MRAALRRSAELLQPLVPRGGGVAVLAYHLVGGGTQSVVDLPLETFRRQMEELAAGARVVSLERAIEELQKPAEAAPRRPTVVLTFDDAYRNFFERAWPVLTEHRLPATLYVPVGFVDGTHPPPIRGAALPPVSWRELRELLRDPLIDVGSHSWSHRDLRRVSSSDLHRELAQARRRLEDELGRPIDGFCYPGALWSPRIEVEVVRHYRHAVVGGGGRLDARRLRLHRLQRLPLRRDMPTSLAAVLARRVWLAERLASIARRHLR